MGETYSEIISRSEDKEFTTDFNTVIARETACINVRRASQGRPPLDGPDGPDGTTRQRACSGLAISGGGIRSAAFALGALQALHQDGVLDEIDYLSTVSGGGYIGTSLTAGLNVGDGTFPFTTDDGDKRDNLSVAHLRNYSNYLMPRGFWDLLASLSVVLRGLAANLILVAGVLLVAAGATLFVRPYQDSICRPEVRFCWESVPGFPAPPTAEERATLALQDSEIAGLKSRLAPVLALDPKRATLGDLERKAVLQAELQAKIAQSAVLRAKAQPVDFFFTRWLLLALLLFHAGWALWRSAYRDATAEFVGTAATISKALTVSAVVVAALELQPVALRGLFLLYVQQGSGDWIGAISQVVALITPYLAPIAAAAAFAGNIFGNILKTREGESGWQALASRVMSRVVLLLVALMLPMTLWVAYLYITVAGDIGFSYRPGWMQWLVERSCGAPDIGALRGGDTRGACKDPYLFARLYGGVGLVVTIGGWLFLTPNGNSLHRLYRDRLSKAFLFDPRPVRHLKSGEQGSLESPPADPPPLDAVRFSDLHPAHGPLHLVNAALNIQGSKYVNQRGRNADFFQFSPVYCGSASTGYIRTDKLEALCPGVDLATAMAVSGAAASSNMGANTRSSFSPTLALLNVRLGYWMPNPKRFKGQVGHTPWWNRLEPYLLEEMFGLLTENSEKVYLTDGGHIENLGLYELLRRRCARIIVLDAEADPQFAFRSLIEAQRYARIDLGIRMNLPWQQIQASAQALDADFAARRRSDPREVRHRTHIARGTIEYGPGDEGEIIYIKASLTGDENDYILDYKARYPDFPQQTTGDQMFSEEQFECYRALGFHAAHRVCATETPSAGPDW